MNPVVGIVTVLYNSETVLEDFFSSLQNQSFRNFRLYVIDNFSPDGSLEKAKTLAEISGIKTRFIANEVNYGVAKGNNQGISEALADDCDFILIANNDIILETNTLSSLIEGMEQTSATMAVPKIYYAGTNMFWAAGGYFQKWSGLVLHYGDRKEDEGQYNKARPISYAATCFMLVRSEVFERNEWMDERYFVYWDDVDFVHRALSNGEKLWYIPNSIVHHKESTSTGFMSDFSVRFLARNSVFFALKNYSILYAVYVILLNITHHCFVLIFKWPFRQWKLRLKSYYEGFKLFRHTGLKVNLFKH